MDILIVLASVAGGLVQYNTKKLSGKRPKGGHIKWLVERNRARRELFLNIVIALVSTVFFIPPLIESCAIHPTFSYAIAFVIGYSGVRLLPAIEKKISSTLDKTLK